MAPQKKKFKKIKHYNTTGHAHELTFSCYHRYKYLLDPTACELFLHELQQAREKHEFKLWAYVLMPNHVHLLIWPMNNEYDIAKILNDAKGRMAKKYRDHILTNHPDLFDSFTVPDKSKGRKVFRFWQPGGGFDRNLWEGVAIHASIEYIEANPVRRKLAAEPGMFQWSSAYARSNNTSLVPNKFKIPVAMLNPRMQRVGVI